MTLLWGPDNNLSLSLSRAAPRCFNHQTRQTSVWLTTFKAPVAFQWSLNTSCHSGRFPSTLLNSYLGMDFKTKALCMDCIDFEEILYCIVNKHGHVLKLLPCSVCSIVGERRASQLGGGGGKLKSLCTRWKADMTTERNFWDTSNTDYSVTKGSLPAIFKTRWCSESFSKSLYVRLSVSIESHMSTNKHQCLR